MAKDQENGSVNDSAERPKCFTSTFQEVLFVLTATMAIGQQSFFQGCIVGVTASIGKDLHMNSAEITWINAGASYVYLSLFQYLSFSRLFMFWISSYPHIQSYNLETYIKQHKPLTMHSTRIASQAAPSSSPSGS
jgi:hypothetical protein